MHDKREQRSGGLYGFERPSQCDGNRPGRLGDVDQEYVSVSIKKQFTRQSNLATVSCKVATVSRLSELVVVQLSL